MSHDQEQRIIAAIEEASKLSPDQREPFLLDRFADDPIAIALINELLSGEGEPSELSRVWQMLAPDPDRSEVEDLKVTTDTPVDIDVTTDFSASSANAASSSDDLRIELPEIPDHKLGKVLGVGGMGVVVEAFDEGFQIDVAIKLMRGGTLQTPQAQRRFLSEARAVAKLRHPGIVGVLREGKTEDGVLWFSMERVVGRPLSEIVNAKGMGLQEAARIARQVTEAIGVAHQSSIYHRDIKPANVLIDQNGQPRVVDFGLAKDTSVDLAHTQDGRTVGTPYYMAPEQIDRTRGPISAATDIYAIGGLLYYLLTCRPPHREPTQVAQFKAVLDTDARSPRDFRKDVDKDLAAICLKCLEKAPKLRYETTGELVSDLQRYAEFRPVLARSIGPLSRSIRWGKRNPIAIGVLSALTILLLVAAIMWRRANASEAVAANRAVVLDEQKQQLAEKVTAEQSARLAAESNLARAKFYLASSRIDSNRLTNAFQLLDEIAPEHRHFEWEVAYQHAFGSQTTCLGHFDWVKCVAMSPDGTKVVSGSGLVPNVHTATLALFDANTGQPIWSVRSPSGNLIATKFSQDGEKIYSLSKEIAVWDMTTGKTLQRFGAEQHRQRTGQLPFEPGLLINHDETKLYTFTSKGVCIWDIAKGTLLNTYPVDAAVTAAALSPDQKQIALCQVEMKAGTPDETSASSLQLIDSETGALQVKLSGAIGDLYSVTYSPDGTCVAAAGANGSVVLWNIEDEKVIATMRGHQYFIASVAFHPDGSQLATASWDGTIKIWDVQWGNEIATLTGHEQEVLCLTYSADGTHLISGGNDNSVKIWDARFGTTASDTRRDRPNTWKPITFSPDGMRYVMPKENKTQILDAQTKQAICELEASPSSFHIVFSDDGKLLATSNGGESLEIWDTDNGQCLLRIPKIGGDLRKMAFSHDAQTIATGTRQGQVKRWDIKSGDELNFFRIPNYDGPVIQFNGQSPKDLSHATSVGIVAFSPNGRWLVSGGGNRNMNFDIANDVSLTLWDIQTGKSERTTTVHSEFVVDLVFSDDGENAWSSDFQGNIIHWNVHTGKQHWIANSKADLRLIRLSHDEQRLASVDHQGRMRLYDSQTGDELIALKENPHLRGVAFLGDNSELRWIDRWENVSAIRRNESRITQRLRGHLEWVRCVALHPDQTQVASASLDDTFRLWDAVSGEPTGSISLKQLDSPRQIGLDQDGQWVVLGSTQRATLDPTTNEFVIGNGGSSITELPHESADGSHSFLPSGNEILIVDRTISQPPSHLPRTPEIAANWHFIQARNAAQNKVTYAAIFHWCWALKRHPEHGFADRAKQMLKSNYLLLQRAAPLQAATLSRLVQDVME